jgi:hypothetical protein
VVFITGVASIILLPVGVPPITLASADESPAVLRNTDERIESILQHRRVLSCKSISYCDLGLEGSDILDQLSEIRRDHEAGIIDQLEMLDRITIIYDGMCNYAHQQ